MYWTATLCITGAGLFALGSVLQSLLQVGVGLHCGREGGDDAISLGAGGAEDTLLDKQIHTEDVVHILGLDLAAELVEIAVHPSTHTTSFLEPIITCKSNAQRIKVAQKTYLL